MKVFLFPDSLVSWVENVYLLGWNVERDGPEIDFLIAVRARDDEEDPRTFGAACNKNKRSKKSLNLFGHFRHLF